MRLIFWEQNKCGLDSFSFILDEKKNTRSFCELKVADDVLMGDVKWRFSGDDCEGCGHQGLPVAILEPTSVRKSLLL